MLNDHHILGILSKYIKLIEATLAGFKAAIRVDEELTATFNINSGVRQEDALST